MELREIMTRNPEVVSGDTSLKEAATLVPGKGVWTIASTTRPPTAAGLRISGNARSNKYCVAPGGSP